MMFPALVSGKHVRLLLPRLLPAQSTVLQPVVLTRRPAVSVMTGVNRLNAIGRCARIQM
jgi:hypothetical protein